MKTSLTSMFRGVSEGFQDFERTIFNRRANGSNQHRSQPEEPANVRHAIQSLPTLPPPRRPITSVPVNAQPHAPLLKIPPELRLEIYRLVLSSRELHVDMRYTAWETTIPHSTKGVEASPTRSWRWRASTCHRLPDAPLTIDRCGWGGPWPTACHKHDTPCGIGKEVLSLLLSCRLVYREAVQVLYAENTFHANTGALLLYTDRLLPAARSNAITSLIYEVTPESVLTYASDHLGLEPGLRAYEVLVSRIPKAFPGLRRLQIVLSQAKLVTGMFPPAGLREPLSSPEATGVRRRNSMLAPVDAVVEALAGRLRECVVVFGQDVAEVLPVLAGPGRREVAEGLYEQVWRAVPAVAPDEDGVCGYWLRVVSEEQLEISFVQYMTGGTGASADNVPAG